MEKELQTQEVKDLYQAVLKLENTEECEKFFRDLCTLSEIKTLTERWSVVKKLNDKVSYRKIYEQTGVSTATVTRVAHWLHHGNGGYQLVLDRM